MLLRACVPDHDQLQTPEVGASLHNGDCKAECDCGLQPCGEYIFNHRNKSFADWFINSCEYRRVSGTLEERLWSTSLVLYLLFLHLLLLHHTCGCALIQVS